jgi:hypothetical protein
MKRLFSLITIILLFILQAPVFAESCFDFQTKAGYQTIIDLSSFERITSLDGTVFTSGSQGLRYAPKPNEKLVGLSSGYQFDIFPALLPAQKFKKFAVVLVTQNQNLQGSFRLCADRATAFLPQPSVILNEYTTKVYVTPDYDNFDYQYGINSYYSQPYQYYNGFYPNRFDSFPNYRRHW